MSPGSHTTRTSRILKLLSSHFSPSKISIKNLSRPYENDGAHNKIVREAHGESHLRVMIVSTMFEGVGHLARHRMINHVLDEEFKNGLHALTITAKSVREYEQAKERMKIIRKENNCIETKDEAQTDKMPPRDEMEELFDDVK
ncbi:hypothetical protein C9374_011445 [Naegleria lovaniensis]|uniref:BolA-like protein n=1 Tax=Naegleria lovaniensis TaxID=51637 RepID=A0AA88GXD3_NAELO|nr:uncharacterized protein C9374_011445 [Naegleria lovaniensis]KAG2392720.1 hypothetical protein C9374_011445 [Naegleria lovaniensis]